MRQHRSTLTLIFFFQYLGDKQTSQNEHKCQPCGQIPEGLALSHRYGVKTWSHPAFIRGQLIYSPSIPASSVQFKKYLNIETTSRDALCRASLICSALSPPLFLLFLCNSLPAFKSLEPRGKCCAESTLLVGS